MVNGPLQSDSINVLANGQADAKGDPGATLTPSQDMLLQNKDLLLQWQSYVSSVNNPELIKANHPLSRAMNDYPASILNEGVMTREITYATGLIDGNQVTLATCKLKNGLCVLVFPNDFEFCAGNFKPALKVEATNGFKASVKIKTGDTIGSLTTATGARYLLLSPVAGKILEIRIEGEIAAHNGRHEWLMLVMPTT